MKKILFLVVIFVLALGAGCKKKVEQVPQPVSPPPVEKTILSEFVKKMDFVSMVSNLNEGQVLTVKVDASVITDERELYISKFPREFKIPENEETFVTYLKTYLFPSVVWRINAKYLGEKDSQLEVLDLQYYLDLREDGDIMWILKDSPKGTPPFKNIPTVLVESPSGKFWILNQKNEEMPRRIKTAKSDYL